MKISFAESALPRSGAVVVGVWEGPGVDRRGPPARRGDRRRDHAGRSPPRRDSAARRTSCWPSSARPDLAVSRIVLAGLGKPDAVDARVTARPRRKARGAPERRRREEATLPIELGEDATIGPAEAAAQLAFGAQLRSYRFDKYRTKQKPEQKPSLTESDRAMPATAGAARRRIAPLEADRRGGVLHPRSRLRAGQRDLSRDPGRTGRRRSPSSASRSRSSTSIGCASSA